MLDCYSILAISPSASGSEIKRAYRRLAFELHPDRNKQPDAHDAFIRVHAAYEILADPKKRRAFDQQRSRSTPNFTRTEQAAYRSAAYRAETSFEAFEVWWRDTGSKIGEAAVKSVGYAFIGYIIAVSAASLGGAFITAVGLVAAFGGAGFISAALHASFFLLCITFLPGWTMFILAPIQGVVFVVNVFALIMNLGMEGPSIGNISGIIISALILSLSIFVFIDDVFDWKGSKSIGRMLRIS